MRHIIVISFFLVASVASAQDVGVALWANANSDEFDTGAEVCDGWRPHIQSAPADYVATGRVCLKVLVPGSATEIACDVDMSGAGTASGFYVVLCH